MKTKNNEEDEKICQRVKSREILIIFYDEYFLHYSYHE